MAEEAMAGEVADNPESSGPVETDNQEAQSQDNQQPGGMLNFNSADQNEAPETNNTAQFVGVESARPEGIPEEFFDAESGEVKIADLAQAYNQQSKNYKELRTKMSQGGHKIPENGEYNHAALESLNVDISDDQLSELKEFARISQMSQSAFDEFAQYSIKHGLLEQKVDVAAQRELLGPRADDIIADTNRWIGMRADSFNDGEKEFIESMSRDARFVSILHKIRGSYNDNSNIPVRVTSSDGSLTAYSKSELMDLVISEKFNKDPQFRKGVEKEIARRNGETVA